MSYFVNVSDALGASVRVKLLPVSLIVTSFPALVVSSVIPFSFAVVIAPSRMLWVPALTLVAFSNSVSPSASSRVRSVSSASVVVVP